MRVDRRQAVIGGVLTALVLGFAGGVWWPMRQAIQADRRAIQTLETKLSMVDHRRQTMVDLAEEVRRLNAELRGRRRVIAPAGEMPAILRQISLQIERAALRSEGITTGETIDQKHVRALPVELFVGGSASSVLDFVESIESMPRLVQVDRLQIANGDEPRPSKEPTVNAQMRLTAYLQAPEGGGR